MVTQAVWDIYPMVANIDAAKVPKGTFTGLVIVN